MILKTIVLYRKIWYYIKNYGTLIYYGKKLCYYTKNYGFLINYGKNNRSQKNCSLLQFLFYVKCSVTWVSQTREHVTTFVKCLLLYLSLRNKSHTKVLNIIPILYITCRYKPIRISITKYLQVNMSVFQQYTHEGWRRCIRSQYHVVVT